MKHGRFLVYAVGLAVSLLQASCLLAQSEVDLTLLGTGNLTLFSNNACEPVILNCPNGCSTTKVCCTAGFTGDCIHDPCTITCDPRGGGGGGGGCLVAGSRNQQVIAVSLGRNEVNSPLPQSSFTLTRTEPGDNDVSYLMEEWVVIAYSSQPGEATPKIEILNASSSEFAAAKSRDLAQGARDSWKGLSFDRRGPKETLLVVEAPVHFYDGPLDSARGLKLSDPEVPAGLSPVKALIRVDFSEDGALQRLQVLHADGFVSQDLVDLLRNRVQLDHRSMEHNRAVVFAMVKIDKVIELSRLATVLPKGCCSGGAHCI